MPHQAVILLEFLPGFGVVFFHPVDQAAHPAVHGGHRGVVFLGHSLQDLLAHGQLPLRAAYDLQRSGQIFTVYIRLLDAPLRIKLLELYNEEKRIMLPETLANAMEEAKATLARTANPQLADFVLDKAYFTELRAAVDKVDSPFLRGYAAILIDSANLRSAVRTLRMGKGQDFLREVLIPDGNVGAERVANATDKDSLAALYAHSALEKAAVLGGEALSGGSMTAFELACDNAVNDYLKGARLISYGCEVPVAYMAAVEGEITAIRMILTGRLAGVPSQTIRERLRDLYV